MLDRQRWRDLWHRLSGQGDADAVASALLAAYAEPHRAYHTAQHIADCLTQFDSARTLAERPDEVEMALWYHDAVYDPKAADNEEQSALWAFRDLARHGIAREVAHRIADLIRATTHDGSATTRDAQLVCDIDLAGLGMSEQAFDQNGRDIRTEFAHVPEPAYNKGRADILERFLAHTPLYQTEYFRQRCEEPARRNLERTIARLRFSDGS